MSKKNRIKCIMCGRIFPKGQGVLLNITGRELAFHSKKCALKFLTRFIEQLVVEDKDKVSKVLDRLLKTLNEERKDLMGLKAKKI